MSESRPNSLSLKLKLKSTDTSRFKTEKSLAAGEKTVASPLSAEATVPASQINDPLDSMRNNTGRLKKVSVNDTTVAGAVMPQSLSDALSAPTEKKNETVKLKVMKAPGLRMPGPATQAPINLNTPAPAAPVPQQTQVVAAPTPSPAPAMPKVSTATASIKLPTLKTGLNLGGLKPASTSSDTASTIPVPAPEKTMPVEAPKEEPRTVMVASPVAPGAPAASAPAAPAPATPAPATPAPATPAPAMNTGTIMAPSPVAPAAPTGAPKPKVAPLTVKLSIPKPVAAAQAAATQVTAAPATPSTPSASRTTATLKIRPVAGGNAGVNTGAASATLKITPVGMATPTTAEPAPAAPAAAAAPAPVPANGEPQLKQTGIKLSLKKSEPVPPTNVVTPPVQPAPAENNGSGPQVMPATVPGSSGLKLKKTESAAPATPTPPADNGGPQVMAATVPGSSGLRLKKADAAATVAAPVMETVKPQSSESAATIAVEPVVKPPENAAGAAAEGEKQESQDVMPEIVPEYDVPLANEGLGKLQGICAILASVALGAACYFVVMDFMKYI